MQFSDLSLLELFKFGLLIHSVPVSSWIRSDGVGRELTRWIWAAS